MPLDRQTDRQRERERERERDRETFTFTAPDDVEEAIVVISCMLLAA